MLATQARIQSFIHRTPVLTCQTLDRMAGASLFFKCENFQKMGAFKMRGAANAILQLTEEQRQRGVATHSSGNFAQAMALAAQMLGIPAYIVMPSNSPEVKKAAVRGYGGEIIECEPNLAAREETLAKVVERTGATFVHPFNDENVIMGQGTAALELLQDVDNLDIIIARGRGRAARRYGIGSPSFFTENKSMGGRTARCQRCLGKQTGWPNHPATEPADHCRRAAHLLGRQNLAHHP
jgi:threonine dehydratase